MLKTLVLTPIHATSGIVKCRPEDMKLPDHRQLRHWCPELTFLEDVACPGEPKSSSLD